MNFSKSKISIPTPSPTNPRLAIAEPSVNLRCPTEHPVKLMAIIIAIKFIIIFLIPMFPFLNIGLIIIK
jgi:hypothetical protein